MVPRLPARPGPAAGSRCRVTGSSNAKSRRRVRTAERGREYLVREASRLRDDVEDHWDNEPPHTAADAAALAPTTS
jgi:hypothetical protein